MTSTDTDQLPLLERDIDLARQRLALTRTLLDEQLTAFGGTADTVNTLITGCDEFGTDYVRGVLRTHPDRFNLFVLPPKRLAVIGPLVEQLADASEEFDRFVVARENILAESEPDRERVYPFYGREAVLDRAAKRLRFIDTPAETEPLQIVAIPNRAAPTVGPDVEPTPKRRRRRDRDR